MSFKWTDTSKNNVVSYSTCISWQGYDCRLVAVVHYVKNEQMWHAILFDELACDSCWLINTESVTATQRGFYDRIAAQGFAEAWLLEYQKVGASLA